MGIFETLSIMTPKEQIEQETANRERALRRRVMPTQEAIYDLQFSSNAAQTGGNILGQLDDFDSNATLDETRKKYYKDVLVNKVDEVIDSINKTSKNPVAKPKF